MEPRVKTDRLHQACNKQLAREIVAGRFSTLAAGNYGGSSRTPLTTRGHHHAVMKDVKPCLPPYRRLGGTLYRLR
jgi:hypothetical protein